MSAAAGMAQGHAREANIGCIGKHICGNRTSIINRLARLQVLKCLAEASPAVHVGKQTGLGVSFEELIRE